MGTHIDGGEQAGPEYGNNCKLVMLYLHSVAAVANFYRRWVEYDPALHPRNNIVLEP